jgi:MoaA/NifB/PqqE/SkfB family radical SAM enzyme
VVLQSLEKVIHLEVKAIKFRCFVTKENASQFPHLVKFIEELQSKEVHERISKMINKDLSNSYVRVEVICDRRGFLAETSL